MDKHLAKDVAYEHCKNCDGLNFCMYIIHNNPEATSKCPCFEALKDS